MGGGLLVRPQEEGRETKGDDGLIEQFILQVGWSLPGVYSGPRIWWPRLFINFEHF